MNHISAGYEGWHHLVKVKLRNLTHTYLGLSTVNLK